MTRNSYHARFLGTVGICLVILTTAILSMNLLVDPLGYFSGNQFFSKNYAFNERLMKPNRLMKDRNRYDCLIFGSSRVTLLDESKVAGQQCFNLSVSAGMPVEFVQFAKWANNMGVTPDLIIVGIEAAYFTEEKPSLPLPKFVREGNQPPGVISAYLSIDVAKFSLNTLLGRSPLPRYYDARFRGAILPSAPVYYPPEILEKEPLLGPYTVSIREHIHKLRQIFPDARFIGYVPPVSAWRRARAYQGGTLDGYLDLVFSTAEQFDQFYEFSIPNSVTQNPTRTYDGSHYDIATNEEILQALNGGKMAFGLAVHELDRSAYRRAFLTATSKFIRSIERK